MILISSFNPNIKQRNIDYTINQLSPKFDGGPITFFSLDHESLAITSLKMFNDNKFFGIGPKLFREYCPEYNEPNNEFCSTHPHNSYLQLMAETGVVGVLYILIPFILIIFVFIKHFYFLFIDQKKLKYDDYQIYLLITIFISLWPIIPTQSFFNNWISIIYYLPIGFYLHSIYSNKAIS